MSKIPIHVGLVGLFDILGYKNLIKNNQLESTANIITDIVNELPEKAKRIYLEGRKEEVKPKVKNIQQEIKSLVVSDTILLALPLDDFFDNDKEVFEKWLIFTSQVSCLLRTSFDEGLPLRGILDYGSYMMTSNCWAGKPFIDAYSLAGDLQISGCALAPGAETVFRDILAKNKYTSKIKVFFRHLTPLKKGEDKFLLINWLDQKKTPADIRQYVINSFYAHHKDVSKDVIDKINNTEISLRHAIMSEFDPTLL